MTADIEAQALAEIRAVLVDHEDKYIHFPPGPWIIGRPDDML